MHFIVIVDKLSKGEFTSPTLIHYRNHKSIKNFFKKVPSIFILFLNNLWEKKISHIDYIGLMSRFLLIQPQTFISNLIQEIIDIIVNMIVNMFLFFQSNLLQIV